MSHCYFSSISKKNPDILVQEAHALEKESDAVVATFFSSLAANACSDSDGIVKDGAPSLVAASVLAITILKDAISNISNQPFAFS